MFSQLTILLVLVLLPQLQVSLTGYYGLIIFLLTALISLAVVLVFSRLGNEFPNEYGGSYLYAKKAFKKHFAFFLGWNQFI